jgi:phage tail sheath protein FI
MVKSPEMVEMKLATMPGISNKNLTAKLIQTCEARADALAIVDLPNIYKPESEVYAPNFESRVDGTTPSLSAKALIQRRINSSYGCTYYPWVQIRDTIDGSPVWVPPSVVALGAMAYTEQRDEVWFAPAGFNRGGLNEGNAGVPVLQVSEQLLSRDRDVLYDANINPIASFVSEGIVIFGQKTLQSTKSALDRINVRRLLIFVKKEVSRISNSLLFDNNLPATWNRFKSLVVPMLESVQTRLGLADFKVVLDETTTTSDLVDRNIMYAKIFLKPARAIEFIAVDFVITRSGAGFADID